MAYSVKIGLAVLFYFVFDATQNEARSSSEEDTCNICTTKLNMTLNRLRETMLKERDNASQDTPEPCKPCTFAGITTVKLNDEVCPQKVMEGDDVCYDHVLKLKYRQITVNCLCTLPYNPNEVVELLQEKSKNPYKGMKCADDDAIDPQVLEDEMKDAVQIDPQSMAKMSECQPRVPSMGSFDKPPPKEVSGGIEGVYDEFQFAVTLRQCKNNEEVRTLKVIRDKSVGNGFDVKCVATVDKEFLEPCECFAKTDYLDQIVSSTIQILIPCLGRDKFNQNKEFMRQMVCNDLIDDEDN